MSIQTHIVDHLDHPIRFVDYIIGKFKELPTKNAVKKAIKARRFEVNGSVASTGVWMQKGDIVVLVPDDSKVPKSYPLDIPVLFEDDFLAIVHKPSGLIVSGNQHRTLENALVGILRASDASDAYKWAKPVHRLDGATSGLVIFAKTRAVHRELGDLFKNGQIEKEYVAVLAGKELADQMIDEPIENKQALTKLEVLATCHSVNHDELQLARLKPFTGRTHQLRIHCASIGYPIVGDKLFGEKGNVMKHKGLFLCARKLSFSHPVTSANVNVEIGVPNKFLSLMRREDRRWEKYNAKD